MRRDSLRMRGDRPFLLLSLRHRRGRRGRLVTWVRQQIESRAADFVTPPEFRGLTLAANEAGRIGGVRLELIAVNGFTKLGACYQQVPLRVLPPFQFDAARPALLYLLNPTAGLFDGDGQLAEIVVRAAPTCSSSGSRPPVFTQHTTVSPRSSGEFESKLARLPLSFPALPFPLGTVALSSTSRSSWPTAPPSVGATSGRRVVMPVGRRRNVTSSPR